MGEAYKTWVYFWGVLDGSSWREVLVCESFLGALVGASVTGDVCSKVYSILDASFCFYIMKPQMHFLCIPIDHFLKLIQTEVDPPKI